MAEDPWGFPASRCGAARRGVSWVSGFQWQHRGWGERGAAEGQGLDAGAANPRFIRAVRRLLPRGRSLAPLVGAAPSLGKGFQACRDARPSAPSEPMEAPMCSSGGGSRAEGIPAGARRPQPFPVPRAGGAGGHCRTLAGSASKAGIAPAGSAAPAPAVCVTLRSKMEDVCKTANVTGLGSLRWALGLQTSASGRAGESWALICPESSAGLWGAEQPSQGSGGN